MSEDELLKVIARTELARMPLEPEFDILYDMDWAAVADRLRGASDRLRSRTADECERRWREITDVRCEWRRVERLAEQRRQRATERWVDGPY